MRSRRDARGRGLKTRILLNKPLAYSLLRMLAEDVGTTIALPLPHEPRACRAGRENVGLSELRERMTVIAQMGTLLLQGAMIAAQSTVERPAGAGPGWYLLFIQITSAASVIVFLVLMLILIPALVKFRKT